MENYLTEKVREARPLGGQRLALTFADGYSAEIDLSPLLSWGPLYEPLRDEENFRKVSVDLHGVPVWVDDDLDFSPGTLRAWCEIGKILSLDETAKWVRENTAAARQVA